MAQCQKEMFLIAWNGYEPFLYQNEHKEVTGLDTLVIKRVFDRAGCKYQFIEMPWKRSLLEIKQGNLDMLPTASITDERKKYALFSVEYRDEEYRIIVRKGEAEQWPLNKLSDVVSLQMRLLVELGAWLGDEYNTARKNASFEQLLLKMPLVDHRALKMLLASHVDGLIMEPPTAKYKAMEQGILDKIEVHPYVVNADPVYFMFSKKTVSHKDIKIINKALLEYKGSAEYKALYEFNK
ncbi:transporter substrate-binding domain-containing protein [Endozoicomonas sp. SM1973]|uniref:Transporter substrate-binding domain-containing protein n=1 Tax=Spartinivicinus marinus TaxID=2994442 RepID=A0A853HY67_9GAMM|nr:transporter substrate-binding domain-containing protein [Spartinivicinus marinus]MCX4027135.1 transporter substrate-binding domain-containing protein [Spartinivicinus marinus]NYZ66143.1 transporter substrate-binding domain-containing protein [Spartinivicinus marinus]